MDIAYVTQSDIIPTRVLLDGVSKNAPVVHFLPTNSIGCTFDRRGERYTVFGYDERLRFRGLSFPKDLGLVLDDAGDFDLVVADEFYQPTTSVCREYCRKNSIPLVVNIRRNDTADWKEDFLFRFLMARQSRMNLKAADRIVSISTRGVGWMNRYFPGYCGKVVVIPNGIRVEDYVGGDGGRFRREHDLPMDKKIVLAVGRPHIDKRLDLCVSMFQRIVDEDCILVVVGVNAMEVGDLIPFFYFRGVRDRVFFVGKLPHAEMKNAYAAADVVVSTSRREPFGFAALESLACRKPVVAFDVGGLCDIIDDGNDGFLVEIGDVGGLAEKVSMLLDDSRLREDFGLWGCDRASNEFGLDNVVNRLLGVYQLAIEKTTPKGK